MNRTNTIAFAVGSLMLMSAPSSAATIAGLVDGKWLVMIDTDTRKVTGSIEIKGAMLLGIDVRPADGKLYGLASDGNIVTIDTKTGALAMKSKVSEAMPAGVTWSVDFNPAADRLRVIGSDGSSYRINVEDGKAAVDGKLRYGDADANKGKAPRAVAAAYTNSVAGTKETALYDIEATAGTFVKQAPPNDGVLSTVGALGVKLDGPVAFDIWSDGKGANVGWLMVGGTLHSVDITTGAAKAVGAVTGLPGKVSDIAILPAAM